MTKSSAGPKTCPLLGRPIYPFTPEGAEVFFVGMNPGEVEEILGEPFVGPSGKLLRRWLTTVGLDGRFALGNVELHRTPGNREPKPAEWKPCLPILERCVASVKPKIAVCVGAFAARTFGGFKGSMGGMIGKFRRRPDGLLVTAIYHPSAFLRPMDKSRYSEMEGLTLETLRQVVDRLADTPLPHYACVQAAWSPDVVDCQAAIDVETEDGAKADPREQPITLTSVYRAPLPVILSPAGPDRISRGIFHNAQYDLVALARAGTDISHGVFDDTMIAAWMTNEPQLALKPLARRILGVEAREYAETAHSGSDWEQYAAQDPVLTWRLWHEHFERRLHETGVWNLYADVARPLQPLLAGSTIRGIRVDQDKLGTLRETHEARYAALRSELQSMAGPSFNPNSPAQVLAYVRSVGLRVTSTDDEHLGPYRGHPFVRVLFAYRKSKDLLTRYARPLSGVEDISCLWGLTGTGRLSSAKRNLQNFPASVKRCLRARPGMVLVKADYSNLEMRIAAAESGEEYLIRAFREGRDIHREQCERLYGVVTPELRGKAKNSNFARLYEGQAEKQARVLDLPVAFVQSRLIPWPRWDAWVEAQHRRAARDGFVTTKQGFRRVLHDLESSDKRLREKAMREAVNTPIQGTGGWMTNRACVLVSGPAEELGGWWLHQEHDSVIIEVPLQQAEEGREALTWAMSEAVPEDYRTVLDFPAKVTVGTHWD